MTQAGDCERGFPYDRPMITSRLTSKAQTTIPQAVRKALGLQPGVEPTGFLPAAEQAAVSRHVSGLLGTVLAAGR